MDAEVDKQDIYLLKGTVRLPVQSRFDLKSLSSFDLINRSHKSDHVD
jgi:hypothetical protein